MLKINEEESVKSYLRRNLHIIVRKFLSKSPMDVGEEKKSKTVQKEIKKTVSRKIVLFYNWANGKVMF